MCAFSSTSRIYNHVQSAIIIHKRHAVLYHHVMYVKCLIHIISIIANNSECHNIINYYTVIIYNSNRINHHRLTIDHIHEINPLTPNRCRPFMLPRPAALAAPFKALAASISWRGWLMLVD